MRFKRDQHLRTQADFNDIRSSGFRRECGVFLFHLVALPERTPALKRVGVIASRRVGNAVTRNRCKRRLRELFRLHQNELPENSDLVLIARKKLCLVDFTTLESVFCETMEKYNKWIEKQA